MEKWRDFFTGAIIATTHEPVAEYNGGGVWSIATWVACSCGWNKDGDATGTFLHHLRETYKMNTRKSNLQIEWVDGGREPECPPDPRFPNGIELDTSKLGQKSCAIALPCPAPRVGAWLVYCFDCGLTALCTAAGRPDDPKLIRVSCKR